MDLDFNLAKEEVCNILESTHNLVICQLMLFREREKDKNIDYIHNVKIHQIHLQSKAFTVTYI